MKLFLALFLVSVVAGRLWFQFFDDSKWTLGDFLMLGTEAAGYLGMIGAIVFMENCG